MKHYQHRVQFHGNSDVFYQAKEWCRAEIGEQGGFTRLAKWDMTLDDGQIVVFIFQNQNDAILFKLTCG